MELREVSVCWGFRIFICVVKFKRCHVNDFFKVFHEWGSFLWVLGGHLGFLTGDLEEMVILDVMDDLILPQGRYPEQFALISLLGVCQE